jgi:hypothetical protein
MMMSRASTRLKSWLHRRLTRAFGLERFDATNYWEARYASGGTSGEGSYGRLADFKAAVLNQFIVEHGVQSVVEFGCGDGNQLSLLRVSAYIGFDISKSALTRCIERFKHDSTKSFFLFDTECFRDADGLFEADAALSLDVIFHLVDDRVFESYMAHACSAARKYLILYTTDYDRPSTGHERPRAVSKWMRTRSEFALKQRIASPFPGTQDEQCVSDAEFLVYERQAVGPGTSSALP